MLSTKEIEFIKEKLTEKFRPEKVILPAYRLAGLGPKPGWILIKTATLTCL
ncbi:MAG: hypothetical protein ACYC6P_14995 [Ignavibacteriaceae bacterium]